MNVPKREKKWGPHRALAELIRSRRKAKPMTQAELGAKLERDANHVARMERGVVRPPSKVRAKLAEVLGGKPSDYLSTAAVVVDDGDDATPFGQVRRGDIYRASTMAVRTAFDSLSYLRGEGRDFDWWTQRLLDLRRDEKDGVPLGVPPGARPIDVPDDEQ